MCGKGKGLVFSKGKQLGVQREGLLPLPHAFCMHTPPIVPLMRPLLGNDCGRLLYSWRAHPRNGFKVVWGCGLQRRGSSSPSSDPRLPVSKAIWGCLKESNLRVTWANLLLEELPPDGNLGLQGAAWLTRQLQVLVCVCVCERLADICACM